MDYKQKVNNIFNELDEIVKLPFGEIPSNVKVNLFEALSKLATACNEWDEYNLGINSSEDRNKENLDKIFNSKPIKSEKVRSGGKIVKGYVNGHSGWEYHTEDEDYWLRASPGINGGYDVKDSWGNYQWFRTLNEAKRWIKDKYTINSSRVIKSSTYQFVAEFDGKYQPRVLDYMFRNGSPSWTDLNEDWSNGKMFTEQELPKVAKQLERYYAENGQGGASDIEIVKDNGESVYLEEFLQEGSFDKAWKRIEDDWLNDTMTK